MRLVTFQPTRSDTARLGALDGDTVVDLAAAHRAIERTRPARATGGPPMPSELVSFFEGGTQLRHRAEDLLDAVREAAARGDDVGVSHPGDSVRLLAPVPRPRRIRDYLTYEGHAAGSGLGVPEAFNSVPICYECNVETIGGPDDEIPWPAYTAQLDFELEIGFFVGRAGRNITVGDAADHIAGVTIFNDVSARDIQFYEMSLSIGPSKGKSFGSMMGPCVLTMDEVDEFAIDCTARVNGEVWTRSDTGGRRYSFADVLAWASYCEPVYPGEFLAVGTVSGGCGLELDRWIAPGDVVELEAAGIGVLRNVVGAPEPAPGGGIASYRGAPRVGASH